METELAFSSRITAWTSRPVGGSPLAHAFSVARTRIRSDDGSGGVFGSMRNDALPQPFASNSTLHWPHPTGAHLPSCNSTRAYAYGGSRCVPAGAPKRSRQSSPCCVVNQSYLETKSRKYGASPPTSDMSSSSKERNGSSDEVSGARGTPGYPCGVMGPGCGVARRPGRAAPVSNPPGLAVKPFARAPHEDDPFGVPIRVWARARRRASVPSGVNGEPPPCMLMAS